MAAMWKTVVEEVGHLDTSRPSLRKFGLVVGGVFLAIATVIAWRRGWDLAGLPTWLGTPGALLVATGLVAPAALRSVYRVWMGLAFVLGFIMTRVILTLVFVLMMVPIGFLLRLVGKEVLDRKQDPAAVSYWHVRTDPRPVTERLDRLY